MFLKNLDHQECCTSAESFYFQFFLNQSKRKIFSCYWCFINNLIKYQETHTAVCLAYLFPEKVHSNWKLYLCLSFENVLDLYTFRHQTWMRNVWRLFVLCCRISTSNAEWLIAVPAAWGGRRSHSAGRVERAVINPVLGTIFIGFFQE